MASVLCCMGFRSRFMYWISLLYCHSKDALKMGNVVSPFFSFGRGTRQGCPHSLSLFALVMEPGGGGHPWMHGPLCRHSAPFFERSRTLPASSFPDSATYSSQKVNWVKSSVLPNDLDARAQADPDIPIPWVFRTTYLGVVVSAKVGDYLELNLLSLLYFIFLYFLRNSQAWVPWSYFKKIDDLF